MNAVKKPLPELTEQQLRLAMRHLARPGWPATLDEVLAHPMYGGLVRGLARSLDRQQRDHPAPLRPNPHWMPAAIRPCLSHEAQRFDARKAAANDRED